MHIRFAKNSMLFIRQNQPKHAFSTSEQNAFLEDMPATGFCSAGTTILQKHWPTVPFQSELVGGSHLGYKNPRHSSGKVHTTIMTQKYSKYLSLLHNLENKLIQIKLCNCHQQVVAPVHPIPLRFSRQ